jgi:hypothetical protein
LGNSVLFAQDRHPRVGQLHIEIIATLLEGNHHSFIFYWLIRWELRILKGVVNELRSRRFDYVLFEFSPWLMMRSQSGDPMELIELIPALGGVCFDSLDSLNTYSPLSRPSLPLRDYVEQLQSALYQNPEKPFGEMTDNDLYGPWDDVLCAFI